MWSFRLAARLRGLRTASTTVALYKAQRVHELRGRSAGGERPRTITILLNNAGVVVEPNFDEIMVEHF
jgi:hypothetical protein